MDFDLEKQKQQGTEKIEEQEGEQRVIRKRKGQTDSPGDQSSEETRKEKEQGMGMGVVRRSAAKKTNQQPTKKKDRTVSTLHGKVYWNQKPYKDYTPETEGNNHGR